MEPGKIKLSEKFTDKQIECLDEHIKTTVTETQNADDAFEYMPDIIRDFETDIGILLLDEEEQVVKDYCKEEFTRLFAEK